MPRSARTPSEFDIYHVTARGVGQQIIFEKEGDDQRRFGSLMRKYLEECEIELYAWCFMQNHVHLLLHCPLESLSLFMKRLLSEYAAYFNWRHERTGHLFQGRFDSEPVNSERHLIATVKYIHQNPKDLGVTDWGAYPWSSYREYVGTPFITNTKFVSELFDTPEAFASMHKDIETDSSLEPGHSKRSRFSTDDEAIARAKELTGCTQLSQIAAAEKRDRDAMIALLKENGFSVRQIARLTGIGKGVVQRV